MKRIVRAVLGATIFCFGPAISASATVGEPSAQAIANFGESAAHGQNFLDIISDVPFKAANGYTFELSQSEDGMTLEIAASDGVTKKISFSFYDDQSGVVLAEDHETMGRFWLTKNEIYIRYRDGWSEAVWPSSGNLQMARKDPDGRIHYTTWYSRDHVPAANPPAAITASIKSDVKKIPAPIKTTVATQAAAPLQVITVKTSEIHTIDQPIGANPIVVGSVASAVPQSFHLPEQPREQPSPESNPSKCLSIETNGAHWGFRNSCGFDIQFAYCVASNSDQLTSCKDGAITGSVAPHGFGALTADKSIGDSADHDFRWIACDGGAGEVVPRMDRSDPPTGRCLRSNAS